MTFTYQLCLVTLAQECECLHSRVPCLVHNSPKASMSVIDENVNLALQMGHRWVTCGSNIFTYKSQMNHQMGYRWNVHRCDTSHKWVTYESHVGCTFKCDISHLLLQTYQSLTPLQPCHTSDTKNESNFRPIKRK